MRKLRLLLLFVCIVGGIGFIFLRYVLAPQIDKIFDCVGVYPTSVTHLAWSDDSQHILIRLERPVEFYVSFKQIIFIPVSSEEEAIPNFTGNTFTQFNVNFGTLAPAPDASLPEPLLSPDEQWVVSLRIHRNNLDVYIQDQNGENERLHYRYEPEQDCFSWNV